LSLPDRWPAATAAGAHATMTAEHAIRNRSGTGFIGIFLAEVTDTPNALGEDSARIARHRVVGRALSSVGSRSRSEDARGAERWDAGPCMHSGGVHSQSGRRGGSTPAQPRVRPWPSRSLRAAPPAGASHPSPRRRPAARSTVERGIPIVAASRAQASGCAEAHQSAARAGRAAEPTRALTAIAAAPGASDAFCLVPVP